MCGISLGSSKGASLHTKLKISSLVSSEKRFLSHLEQQPLHLPSFLPTLKTSVFHLICTQRDVHWLTKFCFFDYQITLQRRAHRTGACESICLQLLVSANWAVQPLKYHFHWNTTVSWIVMIFSFLCLGSSRGNNEMLWFHTAEQYIKAPFGVEVLVFIWKMEVLTYT